MNPAGAAVQQALLLQRRPEILFALQQAPLPEGMADLIRLASDEGSFRAGLAHAAGVDPALLQQAAAGYLRSICLFPGGHGPRVLALNDAHDMRLAKNHHRLLIKWLHPDRNPQNEALAERVNQAWSQLKVKRHGVLAAVAVEPWSVHNRRVLPKSRFAWFLGGLAALSALLLLISLLPEQEVYVSGVHADAALGATEPDSAEQETAAPLAALRNMAWAEPAREPATPNAAPVPAPIRKADTAKPVGTGTFGELPSGKAKADSAAMTQGPVGAAADPAPQRDKPAATFPTAAAPVETGQAAAAVAPPAAPHTQGIAVADAKAMLPLFIGRYRQGDIEGFMALFSRDARNNRGDRGAIAEDYGRLFAGTVRRELDVSPLQWRLRDGGIVLQARYRSKVRRDGDMPAVTNKGTIELVFVAESGEARIQRILIGE